MSYKLKLDDLYKESQEYECPPPNKLAFLGSSIFEFTTYDDEIDELFAKRMIEVIERIVNKTTFEYLNDRENYINYLTMVNTPFLHGKLEWGTSIRSAWFDEYGSPAHLRKGEESYNIVNGWDIPKKNINTFMNELLEWSKEK